MIADLLSIPIQLIIMEWILHPEVATVIFKLWVSPQWTCSPQSTTLSFPSSYLQFQSSKHWRWMLYQNLGSDGRCSYLFISLAEQGHSESLSHSDQLGNSDRSLLAVSAMVSTPNPTVCFSRTIKTYWTSQPDYT